MYYLQIDESSFQCLTCNDVLALKTMSAHFDDIDHKKLYSECCQAYITYVDNEKEKPPLEVIEEPTTSDTTGKEQKPDPQNESNKEIPKPDPLEVKKEVVPEVSANNPITTTEPTKKSTPVAKKPEKAKQMPEKGTLEFDKEICKILNADNYIAMDGSDTWCLLCDWTAADFSMDVHLHSKHHQTLLKMHKERMEKKKAKLGSDECTPAQTEQKPQEIKNRILDMLPKLNKNDIIVDFMSNIAFCKKCSQVLDFNHLVIENHIIEQHKEDKIEENKKPSNNNKKMEDTKKMQKIVEDTRKPQSPTAKKAQTIKKQDRDSESRASSAASTRETDDDIEKLAKANNLVFNRNSNKIYCPACDVRFDSTIKKINKHISDTTHKNHPGMKSTKSNSMQTAVKRAMKDIITDMVVVETPMSRDVIINRKYVLNFYSFILVTRQYRMKCVACDMYLNNERAEEHNDTMSHTRAMLEAMFLVSLESEAEFIREVSYIFFSVYVHLHAALRCNIFCTEPDQTSVLYGKRTFSVRAFEI